MTSSSADVTASELVDLSELLAHCAAVGTIAGEHIKSLYLAHQSPSASSTSTSTPSPASSLHIQYKDGDLKRDPVTQADIEAQEIIYAALKTLYPRVRFVGEEDAMVLAANGQARAATVLDKMKRFPTANDFMTAVLPPLPPQSSASTCDAVRPTLQARANEITIWVDPLDGTQQFTKGLVTAVTTLIGISVDGSAVAGVVYQPFRERVSDTGYTGRLLYGLVGWGACTFLYPPSSPQPPPPTSLTPLTPTRMTVVERPVPVPTRFQLVAPSPAVSSSSSSQALHKGTPNALDRLIVVSSWSHSARLNRAVLEALEPTSFVKAGGCGYKVILVMDGDVDAYVFAEAGTKRWDSAGPEAVLRAAGGSFTDVRGRMIVYPAVATDYNNLSGILATANAHIHSECALRARLVFESDLAR